jgi:hypothetical protein
VPDIGYLIRGEITNVAAAYVILAVLLALLTPIADPARLSVADQVARLESGKIPPDQFDFAFLRFEGGRYGERALEGLKTKRDGPDAAQVSQKANEALDWRTRADAGMKVMPVTPQRRAANITVMNSKTPLPDSFLQQDWQETSSPFLLPPCLTSNAKCEAVWSDLSGDGNPELLLFALPTGIAVAFQSTTDGRWAVLGSVANAQCAGVRDGLKSGKFETVPPLFREIEVGGQRLHIDSGCTLVAR